MSTVLSQKPAWAGFNGVGPDRPEHPEYRPAYTSEMALWPQLRQAFSGTRLNTAGLDRYRSEALRSGSSPWAALANRRSLVEQQGLTDQLMQGASARAAEAEANLAMRGGATSGARERLNMAAINEGTNAAQQAGMAGMAQRAGIDVTDEQNRMTALANLPGMETAASGFNLARFGAQSGLMAGDQANQVNETTRQNAFEMDKWKTDMTQFSANRMAQAIENSKKKGLFD